MEAYSKVHETPDVTGEEVQKWADSLIEEGYDLSEYTSDELYEAYISEEPKKYTLLDLISKGAQKTGQALSKGVSGWSKSAKSFDPNAPIGIRSPKPAATSTAKPEAKPAASTPAAAKPEAKPAASTPAAAKPESKPAASTSTAAKPTAKPSTAAKPAAPAAKQTGDKTKDMATFAKANPKLAAAAAERDRTRGTSATTNPLMKDMKSRLPEPKPAPTLAATAAAASKPTAFNPSSSSSSTAAAKPSTPKPTPRQQRLNMDLDVFDLVKGYLLDEGYAETEEGAMVMMVNMSEGWRESILEVLGGQSGDGYIGHPRLGIKNPMSAPKKPVTSAPKNTGVAGQLGNRAAAMDAAMKQLRNSYEVEGEQLDEISTRLAGKVVNARIERTGAAADRENKARTPQNVRDTVAAADKEARARKLAAGVRKRRSATNEQLEAWVEELIAEGYDLSGYTQEEIAEIYAQELELAESDSIAAMRERAAKRRKQRYGASDTSRGGRDDFKPYTEDDYKRGEKNNPRNTRKEEYVDESQHARENPESHDKDEKKKYEKVRGEKTPMPPRGDKRREDFEKWYRANVR